MREFLLTDWGLVVIMGVVLIIGMAALAIDNRLHPEHRYKHLSDFPDFEEE